MNRETLALDENETFMDLRGFTPFERKIIILGIDKLLYDKSDLLRKYTPIVDKQDGDPVGIIFKWEFNREIMIGIFDINNVVTKSVNEVYKDLFGKSLIN
jgi:hypothetical protein